MNEERILITGGLGCIGAETTKWLVRNSDASVVVCSRSIPEERIARVFHDIDRNRITCCQANVTDASRLVDLLREHKITRVVHLAALQTPDCNANRDLGLQVNLAGTQHLIEAMKVLGDTIGRFVFASSIAVYGPRVAYPPGRVPMDSEPKPVNVYGTWKLAGEHLTRLYCEESGTSSMSLRPAVLFGPGRDAGLTSTPTTAMKAIALGEAYEIPFVTRQDYAYAPDIGAAFGCAVLGSFEGYGAFTLPSHTVDTKQLVDMMRQASSAVASENPPAITVGDQQVPFICDLDFEPFLKAFPRAPRTAMEPAIQASLEVFRQQVTKGWLTSDALE